jgi:4-diphosphocytidyl-2C-methyl-D-erythritol kinase
MSGSGSSVFLECRSEVAAKRVVEALQPDWKVWQARGLDDHPLRSWVSD